MIEEKIDQKNTKQEIAKFRTFATKKNLNCHKKTAEKLENALKADKKPIKYGTQCKDS